jgi:hypothetical protein
MVGVVPQAVADTGGNEIADDVVAAANAAAVAVDSANAAVESGDDFAADADEPFAQIDESLAQFEGSGSPLFAGDSSDRNDVWRGVLEDGWVGSATGLSQVRLHELRVGRFNRINTDGTTYFDVQTWSYLKSYSGSWQGRRIEEAFISIDLTNVDDCAGKHGRVGATSCRAREQWHG